MLRLIHPEGYLQMRDFYAYLSITFFIASILLSACAIPSPSITSSMSGADLTIEEYPLKSAFCDFDMEARCFVPDEGGARQILSKRQAEREKVSDPLLQMPHDAMSISLEGKSLVATLQTTNITTADMVGYSTGEVLVTHAGELIFRLPLGRGGPVPSLQGLWVHDGHWYLEAAQYEPESDRVRGIIVKDGDLLNDRLGYEDVFGFMLMRDKPFFFMRDNKVNAFLDGAEIFLNYDHIQHYGCCSAARNNPIKAENMVSFFAVRGEKRYYVEAGIH